MSSAAANFCSETSEHLQVVFEALFNSGSLNKYKITRLKRLWVFAAPKDKTRKLFHLREDGRFSHPTKRVLYLAPNSWRAAYEVNPDWKLGTVPLHVAKFYLSEVGQVPKVQKHCFYTINSKSSLNLLALHTQDNIEKLNNEINAESSMQSNLKDILANSVYGGSSVYALSRCISDALSKSKMNVDGILYKPRTSFQGDYGPVEGSLNDSMAVVFENEHRKHQILHIPSDDENLEDLS